MWNGVLVTRSHIQLLNLGKIMRNILIFILAAFGFGSVNASSFPPNVEMNRKTIEALIEAGSDPLKPHPLEHHFNCYNSENLKSLMARGKSLGYRVANIGDMEHEGKHYWYGDLIKKTALDLNIINKENSIMLDLANEFSSDYDGWGTPVVN